MNISINGRGDPSGAGDRLSLIISWNLGSCASIKLQSSLNNIRMPETRMANEAWTAGRKRKLDPSVVGANLTKQVSGPVNCVSSDNTG